MNVFCYNAQEAMLSMNSEQNTLPNNQAILEAVNELKTQMNSQFEAINSQFDAVNLQFKAINSQFESVNAQFEEVRLQMMSFDVRIDRLEAMSHELLNIAFNNRADVKVLREEVRAWSKDVQKLEQKVA